MSEVEDQSPPRAALEDFLGALNRGDHPALARTLCRQVTFLTQDATGIHGRERVASLLAQLLAGGLRVRLDTSHMMELDGVALVSLRWEIRLANRVETLVQRTEASLVLACRESR